MISGSTYGERSGYSIDDGLGIPNFKTLVVSFETFDGETWENPLYTRWCELYEGKKLISN